MTQITHRFLQAGDVQLHIAEAGSGPLVLLLHGFPESWYSWRHQLTALADAGFHAVAVDQRGYGRSDRPATVEAYSILHLVGDIVCLLDSLREGPAVLVGHDWGADVAWHTALLRPDLLRGVAGLSLPYRPRSKQSHLAEMKEAFGDDVYINYFQRPGVVDAELAADLRRTFRLMLRGAEQRTHDKTRDRSSPRVVPPGHTFLGSYPEPTTLPAWLTEADIDTYASDFAFGFTGALNWYRNMDRNWELTAALHNAVIRCPALYIMGEEDRVANWPGALESIQRIRELLPYAEEVISLPGVGHWIQQEAPQQISAALVNFARSLPR